ncbi:MAG TPA: aspartyl/asparaginyl beta-hydroxylase domain-containing protein [Caulobacteraceae bacterium]|jgi:aspartyl/asparaginyl beta-hydroxylase (cupin superfamily)|nr:aspartyl/asparaginyl beta-hydroxylase domain-containing protein [Caulobacteraceae bacterium]
MVNETSNPRVARLEEEAITALRAADPHTAREHFQRALALAPRRLDLWMGLAASQRAAGDQVAALTSIGSALQCERLFFPALLMKGSLLEALGRHAAAASAYGVAIQNAPPPGTMSESMKSAFSRAADVHQAFTSSLAEALEADIEDATRTFGKNAQVFIQALIGNRRIYQQEPTRFHFPGLPAIEFWERDEFPFLADLEANCEAIRAEALAVWADGSPHLTPYVHLPSDAPTDKWARLNNSFNWSAVHLWRDGVMLDVNTRQCPLTMAALEQVDMPRTSVCSPAAMFSILRPHTRIPPHTGIANTRLVLHLPLIVPEGCGFRCGGETRRWREGEAFVFDDTIEHEAWNDSDKPRAVLICDVWNPRLSAQERALIARVMTAFTRFNGGEAPLDWSE